MNINVNININANVSFRYRCWRREYLIFKLMGGYTYEIVVHRLFLSLILGLLGLFHDKFVQFLSYLLMAGIIELIQIIQIPTFLHSKASKNLSLIVYSQINSTLTFKWPINSKWVARPA